MNGQHPMRISPALEANVRLFAGARFTRGSWGTPVSLTFLVSEKETGARAVAVLHLGREEARALYQALHSSFRPRG